MWKKIVYYACMVVVGILFMLAFYVTQVTNRYASLVKHSTSTNDYTNVLGIYTTFSNKNAIYSGKTVKDNEVFVFETATTIDTPYEDSIKSLIDLEYSIFIEGNDRNTSNQQSGGINYNYCGYIVEDSSSNSFQVYDNLYKDGIISSENESNIYNGYEFYVDTLGLNLFTYRLPMDFIKNVGGLNDVKSVRIIDSLGNTFANITFDEALTYSSETHTKIAEIKPLYNNAIITGSSTAVDAMYGEWKDGFLAIDGCQLAIKNNVIFNAKFYLKLVGMAILFILFVLIIGDLLVGKRRIIRLFKNVGSNKSNEGSFTNDNKNHPSNPVKEKDVIDVTASKETVVDVSADEASEGENKNE